MGLGSLNSNALNTIPLNGGVGDVTPPSPIPDDALVFYLDPECMVYPLFAEGALVVPNDQNTMRVLAEDRIFILPPRELR